MSNTVIILLIVLYGLIYLYYCGSICLNLMLHRWQRFKSSLGKVILMSIAPLIILAIV